MTDEILLGAVLESLSLPPGLSILLLALGLPLHRSRTGAFFILLALLSLYLSSLPVTSLWLAARIAEPEPVNLEHTAAEAIVVLGADRYGQAPEYGGADTIRGAALERVRYAAWLQKRTGLPILTSGGAVLNDGAIPEAELMRDVLHKEFGAEVRWMETESRNTRENAEFSSRVLKGAGLGEVLLVTHSVHMPRALEAFGQAGIRATPAATGFIRPSDRERGVFRWLPSASALETNRAIFHEIIGRAWYRLRAWGISD